MLGTKTIKNRKSAVWKRALKEAKITIIVSDKKTPGANSLKVPFLNRKPYQFSFDRLA